MSEQSTKAMTRTTTQVIAAVLVFWTAYVGFSLTIGFITNMVIESEVWQLMAWGFLTALLMIYVARMMRRRDRGEQVGLDLSIKRFRFSNLAVGLVLGMAAFTLHIGVLVMFAGPISFERVPDVGFVVIAIFFARFMATSCMEEVGFRSYSMEQLQQKWGPWPAVIVTAIAFGLSHLLYGWSLYTIALGVIPMGVLWGMSAVATRGIAVPVGLHAAWNFSNWIVGGRAEQGAYALVITPDTITTARSVGTVSYLVICGLLTLAFWLYYKRQTAKSV